MTSATRNETHPDLASELAYVRALAEEGRDAPLVGGVYYLLWGALMGIASAIAFLGTSGVINLGGVGILGVWAAAGLAGWGGTYMLAKRTGAKPGAMTLGNKTARSVWFAVGVMMTTFWIALMFVHDDFTQYGVPPYFLFSLMFPVAFGVYGVAFYATAVASRLNWLKGFAVLSWGFCLVSMMIMARDIQFLVGAFGCFLCAALPGVLLMRREPSDIV